MQKFLIDAIENKIWREQDVKEVVLISNCKSYPNSSSTYLKKICEQLHSLNDLEKWIFIRELAMLTIRFSARSDISLRYGEEV
ncbi:hypothetical protein Tco_0442159 [Tanacetum coccineum]